MVAKFTPEAARLEKLVLAAATAKRANKDAWGLQPVEKGWLRGRVENLRQWDEPCEFGTLQVIEFDLQGVPAANTPKPAPVPVRMSGTYFNTQLRDGQVVDVADPSPPVRPLTPIKIFFSHHNRTIELKSYYPGRGSMTQRTSLKLALLAVFAPIVVAMSIVAALRYVFHII